ncbi:MAG: hypothetical protein WCH99_01185 [Verrucomicrobiota bacterium]
MQPALGGNRRPQFAFRCKRVIPAADAPTIQLLACSLNWAKSRRRKAGAEHENVKLEIIPSPSGLVRMSLHVVAPAKNWRFSQIKTPAGLILRGLPLNKQEF